MRVVQGQLYGVRTMAISRAELLKELLKELLPNINKLFKDAHEERLIEQIMLNDLKKAEELKDGIQEQS